MNRHQVPELKRYLRPISDSLQLLFIDPLGRAYVCLASIINILASKKW